MIKPLPKLILAVKTEFFDAIKDGSKVEEFRLDNEFWNKRLNGKKFSSVVITKGYPKADDLEKRIEFPWNGFIKKSMTHPFFGENEVHVFAIQLIKEKI